VNDYQSLAGHRAPGWFTDPLGGGVQQLNIYPIYQLGMWLEVCYLHVRMPLKQWAFFAQSAKGTIDVLLADASLAGIEQSIDEAQGMAHLLESFVRQHQANGEASLTEQQAVWFNQSFNALDRALSIELGRAPIFFVTPKGIYDTGRLMARASAVFDDYSQAIPFEAKMDTDEAGRCLAFSLPTAAGFHIARAAESVIKMYMEQYQCPTVKESQRNWGKYTESLRGAGAPETICNQLDQLRVLHRNPLTHPEHTLDLTDAKVLWAMCESLMLAMARDMIQRAQNPPKPSSASSASP
jgi:hypothetical protein